MTRSAQTERFFDSEDRAPLAERILILAGLAIGYLVIAGLALAVFAVNLDGARAAQKGGLYGLDPAKALQHTLPAVERKIRQARAHPADRVTTSCLPASLREAMATIEDRWGGVRIISTHRPGATIRNSGRRSKHADCHAVDFKPAPGTKSAVWRWIRKTWQGGAGIYSGALNHIHIDTGPRYRWVN